MRLEADKLRQKLLAAVAEEKGAALEAAREEKASALRREKELEEMISSNAEKIREASKKTKKKGEGEGQEEEQGSSRLLLVDE